jgi:hypothetical protein
MMDVGPDLARLLHRFRRHVEPPDTTEARLQAIAGRAKFMLRRLGDPETEAQDLLAALAWIVEVAEEHKPVL